MAEQDPIEEQDAPVPAEFCAFPEPEDDTPAPDVTLTTEDDQC